MATIEDFIARKRKELAEALAPLMDQRAQLDAKISRLRKELTNVEQAARAIGLRDQTPEVQLIAQQRTRPAVTIKDAVLDVLAEHPEGLRALEILSLINQRFELGIVRTSLSPQLSRLKHDDHKITNDGPIWMLKNPKKESPAK